MAGTKEIRTQIKSIQNTQKITKAMEMVAASKMRKAQDRMEESRPYAQKIHDVIGHVAMANAEYKHPFMVEREVKRVALIIVSTDRGLCGGLNTNLFKKAVGEMRRYREEGVEVDLCVVGNKALQFFKRLGGNIVAEARDLGDRPHITDLIGSIKVVLDNFRDGKVDRVVLLENKFVNTMTQQPEATQLLPTAPSKDESLKHH